MLLLLAALGSLLQRSLFDGDDSFLDLGDRSLDGLGSFLQTLEGAFASDIGDAAKGSEDRTIGGFDVVLALESFQNLLDGDRFTLLKDAADGFADVVIFHMCVCVCCFS